MDMQAIRQQIKHVVVLMMENRSFDHMLGDFSRVNPDCDGLRQPFPNFDAAGTRYLTSPEHGNDGYSLPLKPTFDPKHDLGDVKAQLGGSFATPQMIGFVQNAIDNYGQQPTFAATIGQLAQRVMNFYPFGTKPEDDSLPALHRLAREFVVCDRWFSSVPGPTWPNRFFAMMGSAHGRVIMPSGWTSATTGISTFAGQICQESIFSLMAGKSLKTALYSDGAIPLANMAKGSGTRLSIDQLALDVQNDATFPAFAWIEPDHSYEGTDGNSQHPPEDVRFGDAYIGKIYNLLRKNAELWNSTLFVVTWDEHGGFFDHVEPPSAVPPDATPCDADPDFKFDRLGVRVPALLISPWLVTTVDHGVYDHTSLLAFVCDLFDLKRKRLGARVAAAAHFGQNPALWLPAPRVTTDRLSEKEPPRPRALLMHEGGLAVEQRMLVMGLHAYLNGGDPERAVANVAAPDAHARIPADRLEEMADEIRDVLGSNAGAIAATREVRRQLPGKREPLRLLCVHGVGHGDAETGWSIDPGWQARWRQAIATGLRAAGSDPDACTIDFLDYDDLFGDGPSPVQYARAIPLLFQGCTADRNGTRAFGWHLPELLRWTAGMTVQWLEQPELRERLCERLQQRVAEFKPHAILAHSLGSLIAYDGLRRALVAGGSAAQAMAGTVFASFGSQIAHPVVMREVWGGTVPPLSDGNSGVATWFHLYNPNDHVFTCPIPGSDPHRVDLVTDFDDPASSDCFDLNHSGESYLAHRVAAKALWPAIARTNSGTRALPCVPPALLRSARQRRRALLIGINNYPVESMRLNGCVNDVFLISQTLQRSGYDASEIRLLLDERATSAEIQKRIKWLVEGANAGDERVLFYSGHGAQIPEYGAGGEPDHMDETLVPVDFDWDKAETHFTDKQFRQFYSHLPFGGADGESVSFTAIFDCCHAGGMTRGNGLVRGIGLPPDIRHRMLHWNGDSDEWQNRRWLGESASSRVFTPDATKAASTVLNTGRQQHGAALDVRNPDPKVFQRQLETYGHKGPFMPLLIYAAGEEQLASEYEDGALSYGAFTFTLVEQLKKTGKPPLTFGQLIERVRASLRRRKFDQTPQLHGPRSATTWPVPWRPSGR